VFAVSVRWVFLPAKRIMRVCVQPHWLRVAFKFAGLRRRGRVSLKRERTFNDSRNNKE
jgi:hypothetical protein